MQCEAELIDGFLPHYHGFSSQYILQANRFVPFPCPNSMSLGNFPKCSWRVMFSKGHGSLILCQQSLHIRMTNEYYTASTWTKPRHEQQMIKNSRIPSTIHRVCFL